MATVIDRHSQPTWRDFLELTKPKVVVLMLITSLIGMLLATKAPLDGFVPWQVLIFGNLGIGLCAGAAAAVNHVVDRRIDSIMARTHKRPLAEGRVSPSMALGFALLLALAGMAVLLAFTNPRRGRRKRRRAAATGSRTGRADAWEASDQPVYPSPD